MRAVLIAWLALVLSSYGAGSSREQSRPEAEYYADAYSRHYGLSPEFVRSIIQQESGWQACVASSKGAVGLMQLMPETAWRLGVRDRCNIRENISGGVRYLARLTRRFHGDYRLVAAAYYAGEHPLDNQGLNYGNPDVVAYVYRVRSLYRREHVRERVLNTNRRRIP